MRIPARLALVVALVCSFSACVFKEPVFADGFAKTDPALGGVWVVEGENGDPRKTEFATCIPLDDDRYVLHHPVGDKSGIYYEARPLKVQDRSLLQLRMLATFSDGLPKADTERYTLLWIEKDASGESLRLRSLGNTVKEKGPAAVKELLEKPSSDWSKLFGEPAVFRRLKDN